MDVKTRINRQRARLVKKQNAREMRNNSRGMGKTNLPFTRIGNRDWGCPFHGKDLFSGQWQKFSSRSWKEDREGTGAVTVLIPYDNNKYNVHGGRKGV